LGYFNSHYPDKGGNIILGSISSFLLDNSMSRHQKAVIFTIVALKIWNFIF